MPQAGFDSPDEGANLTELFAANTLFEMIEQEERLSRLMVPSKQTTQGQHDGRVPGVDPPSIS